MKPRPVYRPRSPKKRRTTTWLIALSVLFITYGISAALWPVEPVPAKLNFTQKTITNAEDVMITMPNYGQTAVAAPKYGLLQSTGESEPAPIASITKIVTALTVLDQKPLLSSSETDTITFTDTDVASYNSYLSRQGTVGPVTPGQTITREDMLRITLISSANNYADRLAIDAFGSLDAYVIAANAFLQANNLTQTVVADASGFSPESKSNAIDLVKLGELALDNPTIAEAINTEVFSLEGYGTFRSTNFLLSRDEAIEGIKTGTTDEAGSCLLYAKTILIDNEEITVIGATLGAPNGLAIANDAESVLNTTAPGFSVRDLLEAESIVGSYTAVWGAQTDIIVPNKVSDIIWTGNDTIATATATDIQTGSDIFEVGSIEFAQNSGVISSSPIRTAAALEHPSLWWRLTHPHILFQ